MPHPPNSPQLETAIQALLENEALTSDINDIAANVLLDWGVSNLRQVFLELLNLPEYEVEAASHPRQRANRKMMRQAASLAANRGDDLASALTAIMAEAAVVYGAGYAPPTPEEQAAFIQNHADAAQEIFLARLRDLARNR